MPRQARIQGNRQKQITEQDTFRFSTPDIKRNARTVDAFAAPTMSRDAEQLLAIADSWGQTAGTLNAVQKHKQDADKEAGMIAAAKGQDPGEDATNSFLVGHETFQGMAAAGELKGLMDKAFEENKDLGPEDFQRAMDAAPMQFMAGRSEPFVKGIMADAVDIQKQTFAKYQTHVQQKLRTSGADAIRKRGDYDIMNVLTDKSVLNKPKAIRGLLSDYQAMGKAYNLDRNEVTGLIVEMIGPQAAELGIPELMDFALEDDGTGNAAIHSIHGTKIQEYRFKAETQKQVNADRVKNLEKEALVKATNSIETAIVDAAVGGDFKSARAGLDMFSAPDRNDHGIALEGNTVMSYYNFINKLESGQGFAPARNAQVYWKLNELAREGKLDGEVLNANSEYITADDSIVLMKANASAVTAAGKAKKEGKTPRDEAEDAIYKQLGNEAAFKNPLTGVIIEGPTGDLRKGEAQNMWWEQLAIEQERKGGKLSIGEMKKLKDDILETVYGKLPSSKWERARRQLKGAPTKVKGSSEEDPKTVTKSIFQQLRETEEE